MKINSDVTAGISVVYDKIIKMPPDGVRVFSVSVTSTEDAGVYLRFENLAAVCLNCKGKDYLGEDFEKTVKLKKNEPHNFWCAVRSAGSGLLVITDICGEEIFKGDIRAEILSGEIADNLSRLVWLDSDLAIDNSVPKPFKPIIYRDETVKIAGREITFDDSGFPLELTSYFSQSVKICGTPTPILSGGVKLSVGDEEFSNISGTNEIYEDKAVIRRVSESENFTMTVEADAEFDGFVGYKVSLTAKNDVEVDDIALKLPISKRCRKYFIGLGKKGGLFDEKVDWKWNENFDQDGFWVGDVNAGVKIRLKGKNYLKPFVNIYYNHRKLNKPESWDNSGRGGIRFNGESFIAYSGSRTVKAGETLRYDFDIIVTPTKEIDLKKQFSMRFFHAMFDSDTWLEKAKKGGANIINVHHGNDLNPYINYPFVEENALKNFVKAAHDNDIEVKIYYTVRELTVNMPEFKALRDFDHEIISERNKNVETLSWQEEAKKWIEENVGGDVIPAWRQPLKGTKYNGFYDSAVITEGQSRLCNFYIEGLNYLIDKTDIDGIYIDDVAYDRNTMKRVRKILDKKPNAYIDFHQWNHYCDLAGRANCAALYTELYPYVDKCWIGEGFDYNETPEFWLTEISGIPFGVMSEMMDTGNEYRGLTFGMTNRLGWETNESDPLDIWKIFDDYDLGEAELIGWWDDRNDVVLSNYAVRATEYILKDKKYVAVANFSSDEQETEIYMKGDERYSFYAPDIERFQRGQTVCGSVKLKGGEGLFLIVNKK